MPSAMCDDNSFHVISLPGLQPFRTVWEMQKEINAGIAAETECETLIFLQHQHVFTLGFHGDEHNMLADSRAMAERGIELVRIERGGEVTYHGPGQLVVYVLINLWKRPYGIRQLVGLLEQAVKETCRHFDIATFVREDAPGVWCHTDHGDKKICALGLKVRNGVTMHGIALNVATDLEWFNLINPCGFAPGSVTSMEKQLQSVDAPSIAGVEDVLRYHLTRLLKY